MQHRYEVTVETPAGGGLGAVSKCVKCGLRFYSWDRDSDIASLIADHMNQAASRGECK